MGGTYRLRPEARTPATSGSCTAGPTVAMRAMTCSDFQDRFSDYFDGTAEPSFLGAADAHLAECMDCRRYHDVISQGSAILRSMPPVVVADDFFPRLQHRIYHLEDGPALSQADMAGSGTTVATTVAIAVLIALAAWSPALVRPPQVALAPIVVSQPGPRVVGVRPPLLWTGSAQATQSNFTSAVDWGLWDDPQLFVRYSPLAATSVRQGPSGVPILFSADERPR